MKLFIDEYDNIRPWVQCALHMLIMLACIALALIGTFALVKIGRVALGMENKPNGYETITITSKEQRDAGIQCFKFITLNCWHNYDYYINEVKVKEEIYNSVDTDKTYTCEKYAYGEGYRECEEVE